ncbi:hypothetical protein H4R19_003304, partial [Coemansia spiralis]
LVLSPDAEVVAAGLELLLNTIRLEAMARTLDEELDAHALKMQAHGQGGGSSVSVRRPRRARGAGETPATPSGGESGSQTPLFGFRPPSRTTNLSAAFGREAAAASAPSMLPDGLVSLVALVLHQWTSAMCPPPQVPPPLAVASLASTRSAMAATARNSNSTSASGAPRPQQAAGTNSAQGPQNPQQQQQQQQQASGPPTEPELREACTWVLLNYELVTPEMQQQMARRGPVYVVLTDLFGRYLMAKQGQTVPQIGRPLALGEMARVVSAVFPKAPMQVVSIPPSLPLPGQPQEQQPTRVTIAHNLRQKSQQLVPIPAVAVEGAPPRQPQPQPQPQPAQQGSAVESPPPPPSAKSRVHNACNWAGCTAEFESEEQARAHIAGHIPDADACRWHSCNRIPAGPPVDGPQLRLWVARHVLIHGPFFTAPPDDGAKNTPSAASDGAKQASASVPSARNAESLLLNTISPQLGGRRLLESDQQQRQYQVLQLVLQGVGVVEQLQRWADRRSGPRGEQDRVRVWRCGDDVLERMAFVAAQPTPISPYATRLLAIISKANIPARSTVSTDTTSGAAHNTAGAGVSSAEGGSGSIAALAKAHWAGRAGKWSVDVVRAILAQHIVGAKFARAGLQALERAQYLEQYLWRHYPDDGSGPAEVVVSVLLMVNEKLQQRLQASAWAVVASDAARFARLFDDAVDLMNHVMAGTEFGFIDGMSVRSIVAQFLIGCFGSLETRAVRDCVMPLVSVAIWHHVDGAAERERALAGVPQLRKFWKHANKRCRGDGAEAVRHRRDRDFLPALVRDFVRCQFAPGGSTGGAMAYGAKVLELLADLESQLATRRYVHLLLADMQVVSLCERSPWIRLAGDDAQALLGRRFRELVGRLRTAADAQVRDVTGGALTDGEARDAHYQKLADLQLTAFEHFPRELEALAVSSVARLGDSEVLAACLAVLDRPALLRLSEAVGIRHRALVLTAAAPDLVEADGSYASDFVVAAFGERYRQRPTAAEQARTASPYPTEQLLYSAAVDEADGYERQAHAVTYSTSGDSSEATSVCYPVLAVPKLNLQFLTVHDYLARSFELLQLESAHEIREDVEDAVRRLQPRATYEDAASGGDRMATSANTHFAGWARMAVPLRSLEVSDVQRPRLGEAAPARVRADISVDLGDHAESIRREWDEELRPRDVLILCAAGPAEDGPAQRAVRAVRGCEIECRLDAAGRPIGVDPDNGEARDGATTAGSVRRFRVLLDRQQYHADVKADSDLYAALNVVVRRRPQESNFKAVLETIRDLMASPPALPGWLAATFLGYGDLAAAAEEAQWTRAGRVWLGDTFVSEDHVRECLAPLRVEFPDGAFATPCIVEFPADADAAADGGGVVRVTQAAVLSMGPAELAPRRTNQIRFTAAQVAAIG